MNQKSSQPGTVLGSRCFEIMFVAGHQVGIGCYLAEYETDWTKLMEIVIETFEEVNNVVPDINIGLNTILSDYAKNVWIGAGKQVKVVTEICDEKYFLFRDTKSLYVTFFDDFSTSLQFFIRRKQTLRSLKQSALHTVTEALNDKSKIEFLEVPQSLKLEAKNELESCWVKRSPRSEDFSDRSERRMINRDVSWRAAEFGPVFFVEK